MKRFDGLLSPLKLRYFFTSEKLKDDHYVIYAALKSSPDTRILSNDYYANQWTNLEEHGGFFRRWLLNRRVRVAKDMKRLHYPPKFEVKVTKVRPNTWIAPYFVDDGTINFIFGYFKFFLCQKIK